MLVRCTLLILFLAQCGSQSIDFDQIKKFLNSNNDTDHFQSFFNKDFGSSAGFNIDSIKDLFNSQESKPFPENTSDPNKNGTRHVTVNVEDNGNGKVTYTKKETYSSYQQTHPMVQTNVSNKGPTANDPSEGGINDNDDNFDTDSNDPSTDEAGSPAQCSIASGAMGICVLMAKCRDSSVYNKVCGNLKVCCKRDQVLGNEKPPKTLSLPDPMESSPGAKIGCGYSNPGVLAIRTGGSTNQAEFGEFPWMVAVLTKTLMGPNKNSYLGGGSIIHPSVVLTAANRLDGLEAKDIKVRAGEWDTQTDEEEYPYQERDVKKLRIHEEYFRPSALNNMALLFTEQPFEIANAPNVGVACIGYERPPPGTKCYTTGWGGDAFKTQNYPVVLEKKEIQMMTRRRCQSKLRLTRLGPQYRLHNSLMCAQGKKGEDACKGDSGAPLICPIGEKADMRYAQYGAVSWGLGCGAEDMPGVYVYMSRYRSWVAARLAEENLDPDSFEYIELSIRK